MLSVALALLAAVGNAAASVLQQLAAREGAGTGGRGRLLLWALLHNPVWLGGFACMATAIAVQAAALATGPLSLVQPLLVLELPLTLLLAARVHRTPLRRREWSGVAAMAGGLAVLLVAMLPSGGSATGAGTAVWIAGLAATLLVCGVLVRLGRHREGTSRALWYGLATGAGFGLTAALISTVTGVLVTRGLPELLTTWQTWTLVVVGPAFFVLLQRALAAGPLIASQPALTLANPVVAALLGVLVFGERTRAGGWLLLATAGAVLIAAGTFLLARSSLLPGPGRSRRPGR